MSFDIRAVFACAVVHVHCIGSGLKMLFWAQRGEEETGIQMQAKKAYCRLARVTWSG